MALDARSLTLAELQREILALGLPRFRADQIFTWIHGRGVSSTEPMTNLSRELRVQLAAQLELAPLEVAAQQRSQDGTAKLGLRCSDGALIETVLIPSETRLTQCLSTQVGCALGCTFCATATMGLVRNLTPGEIVDQVYRARELTPALLGEERRISNLVFMGMGEPLANLDAVLTAIEILSTDTGANFSPRRITVSTAGHVAGIKRFGERARAVGLAISLHATTDEVRDQLVPLNRRWPLAALFAALRTYPLPRRRRITFEYMLIAGLNDTEADARRLPRLLAHVPAKINLLPYNPCRIDEHPEWRRPTDDAIERFAEALRAKGLNTTVRQSRGLDIDAACGQLAAKGSGQRGAPDAT